jgi:hypothetical protein
VLTSKAKYAPSIKKLAWAKFKTFIRPKIRVSPLESINRSKP